MPIENRLRGRGRDRGPLTFGKGSPTASSGSVAVSGAYLPSNNPTSLVAWFRKGVGVTVTGSGVSTWADQSGNGRDLLQGIDANRPGYDGSAIITFDGIAHFLKCALFTLNQPTQVSMLFKQVAWGSNLYIFDGITTNSMAMFMDGVAGSPAIAIYAGSLGPVDSSMTVGSFFAVSALFSNASSLLKVGAGSDVTGTAGTANAGGFTLGKTGAGGGYTNIAVKEIIIRNVDDATIRANDHTYLMSL